MMGLIKDEVWKKVYTDNIIIKDENYDIVSPKDGEIYYVSVDPIDPYYGEIPYIEPITSSDEYNKNNYNRSQLVIKKTYNEYKEYYREQYVNGTPTGETTKDNPQIEYYRAITKYLTSSDIADITSNGNEITIELGE